MEKYAQQHKVPIIGKDGAGLLAETAAASRPASVLEIGTAIGYSTLIIAENLAPCGVITTIEISPERAGVAKDFFSRSGFADRINLLVGDAAELIPNLPDKFDLVFIDAAKGQYLNYLLKCLDKLLPGAVIIADNVLFRGLVTSGEKPGRYKTIVSRLRSYLEFVNTDRRFSTVLHPVGDGVAISVYRGE